MTHAVLFLAHILTFYNLQKYVLKFILLKIYCQIKRIFEK